MTTLLEARWLAGSRAVPRCGRAAPIALAGARFFAAKVREQQERHLKANDTAYNLNPTSRPGRWGCAISRPSAGWPSATGAESSMNWPRFHALEVTPETAQAFLWKVRFGLHLLRRHEDRLLFVTRPGWRTARLRRWLLHAGRRAADAALLPHGDGCPAAQRTAAALFREAILGDSPAGADAQFRAQRYLEATSPICSRAALGTAGTVRAGSSTRSWRRARRHFAPWRNCG